MHVVLIVTNSNPDAVASNLSNGATLSNSLSPLGFSVNPSSVKVSSLAT